jgi:hypothetical protein
LFALNEEPDLAAKMLSTAAPRGYAQTADMNFLVTSVGIVELAAKVARIGKAAARTI